MTGPLAGAESHGPLHRADGPAYASLEAIPGGAERAPLTRGEWDY